MPVTVVTEEPVLDLTDRASLVQENVASMSDTVPDGRPQGVDGGRVIDLTDKQEGTLMPST